MKIQKIILAGVLALSSQASLAAESTKALEALLDVLRKDGTLSEEKYTAIKALVNEDAANEELAKEKIAQADAGPKINTKGKLEITSPDDDFSFRLGGRIMAQAAVFNEDQTQLGDGSEMRRARLFASGKLWKVWKYKLQYDFTGSGKGGIADAYIQYAGIKGSKITLGHIKEPFTLEYMTSSKYTTFIERSLMQALTNSRNLGINYATGGENWTAGLGLYGQGIDTPSNNVDESHAIAGRVTYAPFFKKNEQGLHLGLGYAYRDLDENQSLRLRSRPETHVTDVRLVDTGSFDADSLHRYGLEAMWFFGPLALQTEYTGMKVDRAAAGNHDVDFSAYYIEGSWFLTGESINYNPAKGAMSKITPKSILGKGGLGAWQIAARFSSLDLSDQDINGGEEQNLTLGLNWYPNPHMRFMANYINVLDVDGGPNAGDEPSAFVVQAQLEF